jgi:hypothetical protein
MLTIYSPWRDLKSLKSNSQNLILFNKFINSKQAPAPLIAQQAREKEKYYNNKQNKEPIIDKTDVPISQLLQDADEELIDTINITSTLQNEEIEQESYPFNFGENYKWDTTSNISSRLLDLDPQTWLQNQVDQHNIETNTQTKQFIENLQFQQTNFDNLFEDQKNIAAEILLKLKEWYTFCKTKSWSQTKCLPLKPSWSQTKCLPPKQSMQLQFKPLRMTVRGVGGTGKSTLINFIQSAVQKKFQSKDAIQVIAPTGVAANITKGQTIHYRFEIPIHKTTTNIPASTLKRQLQKNSKLIVLILDERSMVSSSTLFSLENIIRHTTYNGVLHEIQWAAIPIIVLFGDDGQLPPPVNPGIFSAFKDIHLEQHVHKGNDLFKDLAERVATLYIVKRQKPEEKQLLSILQQIYDGNLTDENACYLLKLDIDTIKFSDKERQHILNNALYSFHENSKVREYNEIRLFHEHSNDNPVARIRAKEQGKIRKNHFEQNEINHVIHLCVGAKVQLKGRNIKPEWGLYNGARGVIKSIHFHEGESPNTKDLPSFVLVNFPMYSGPPFDSCNPKHVPLVPIQFQCKNKCCTMTQLPLTLSYATTNYKLQGKSIGSNQDTLYLICDPGPRKVESTSIGMFYMCLGRTQSTGPPDDPKKSNIFFQGSNFNKRRIIDIYKDKKGKNYQNYEARQKWIKYLDRRDIKRLTTSKELSNLTSWLDETLSENELDSCIQTYKQLLQNYSS